MKFWLLPRLPIANLHVEVSSPSVLCVERRMSLRSGGWKRVRKEDGERKAERLEKVDHWQKEETSAAGTLRESHLWGINSVLVGNCAIAQGEETVPTPPEVGSATSELRPVLSPNSNVSPK